WAEYCWMPQVRTNETPGEWKQRIWARLTYFRENDLLPNQSKKYLEARGLYIGQRKKNIGNYNHIGIEKHWKFSCTGNKYCGVNYEKYSEAVRLKQKSNFERNYDEEYALHRYELWECNAIRRLKRAREVGKKIQACIEKSWNGFTALMDSMLINSPYTMHVYKILEQKCVKLII
ncbi:8465_t:CDS:2, partial [Paraglomus occultum]